MPLDAAATRDVLRALRRDRRARRVADVDWVDALYKVYVTAIAAVLAVGLLSTWVSDERVTAAQARTVAADGPAVVGLLVAVALAIGLRSGGHGGPLALEAADVRHVLLAPAPRAVVLRGPALRQLRYGAFAGAVVGAVAGNLAARRLPGNFAAWVACGALVGAVSALGALGVALVVSGRRVPRWLTTLLAAAVVAWSALDVWTRSRTSPLTLAGRAALWPLGFHAVDAVALLAVALAAAAGLLAVGGTSIEAAERRAALVGQLRFAVTLQDLRTVLLLRRQLAQERPRARPWLRVHRGHPVWVRGWRGILRWPAVRVARVVVLGAVAGLALRGAWSGTTPLVVVGGLAMYVVALEGVEALGQELDHPDLTSSFPQERGVLHLAHLPAAVAVTALAGLAGVLAAAAVGPDRLLALGVGVVMVVPAAAAAVGGAAGSTIISDQENRMDVSILPPEAVGMATAARIVWPPAVAVLGTLPVLSARSAFDRGEPAVGGAASGAVMVVLLAVFLAGWVRFRDEARAWMAASMEQARQGTQDRA